jgi:ankyrin repeat protein
MTQSQSRRNLVKRFLGVFLFGAICALAAPSTLDQINAAIRANDLAALRRLVVSRDTANVANGLKVTPLHYAALNGSVEALKILLDQGADPNARNQAGATPLVYAAWSFERSRLLVEHGASVNVATNQKITPLLVAAAAEENARTVRYLLNNGADIKAQDEDGEDALTRAAFSGDVETLKLLLERGGDPKHADKSGYTALMNATIFPDARRVRMLLDAGSDVNALNTFAGIVKNGPIALTHMSTLTMAAPFSDQQTIRLLLKAGAHVNEKDCREMTPLMLAVATDHAQMGTVRQLIAAGADVQAKDKYGDSVLDWARKMGNPEIVSLLVTAGAKGKELPAAPIPPAGAEMVSASDGVQRALTLFGKSDFFRAGGGCAGCHHQPAHARAFAAARNAHLAADVAIHKAFLDAEVANRPRLLGNLPYLNEIGGDVDAVLTLMTTNLDLHEAPSELTDVMVHFLAVRQDPSGSWVLGGVARPPLEESPISRTAQALQVIKHYAWPARQAEFDSHIRKARAYLQKAKPETTYEQADRIVGLQAAGVSPSELRADVERLLKLQREDGGWAQTQHLESDAFATGMVLDQLCRADLLKETDAAYRHGTAFLLRTQFPDGSWYVRSRAPKFQPYFQSGLPFDHDQWISSIGTAWAAMALSHAANGPASTARR